MNKNLFYEKLNKFGEGSELIICWNRGNGTLERRCCFKGFEEGKPLLYLTKDGTLLDIDTIGYDFIISMTYEI